MTHDELAWSVNAYSQWLLFAVWLSLIVVLLIRDWKNVA